MLGQRSPTILPIEEFVSETKFEFRMLLQIADCANAERARATARHNQRIGIVEPERLCAADARFRELAGDLIERKAIASLEYFLRDRAGVFGI